MGQGRDLSWGQLKMATSFVIKAGKRERKRQEEKEQKFKKISLS